MKILSMLLAAAVCCASTGADAQNATPRPATVADYMRKADEQFSSGRYLDFVGTCRQWEALRKDFSASYNIALGLLHAGDVAGSKAKIAEIAAAGLNAEQREKIDQLRQDVVARERHAATRRSVVTGSVIMSRGPLYAQSAAQVDGSPPNRSGASLGLKPEHADDFVEGLNRMQLEQAGYDAGPRVSSRPMDLPAPVQESEAR
ncbi:hypothetical protein [Pseudoduganella buxea]|uniref:Uncharacterized protein n=1 Tax=Pseudoduganella buxea TaxID=1949069 RepID=A0A6I3STM6_9BURK|nr:hypothetical protein [Pseudoduganella buxea]MTV52540.1 hypothetical protein [Pseudoduganella buxea]GGB88304.1 hypothetical protein GCM10011572_07960 [Pseudoduganella buxea]